MEQVEAQLGLAPIAGAAATSRQFIKPALGDLGLTESFEAIMAQVARVEAGDLSGQRAMLVAQSVTLNAIFNEMARRTAANMSSHIDAAERYMRMAAKGVTLKILSLIRGNLSGWSAAADDDTEAGGSA